MQQLFYITLDPEKALGIEDLLVSYHILYSEPSQLARAIAANGIDIKNFPKPSTVKINSTSKMLENPELIKYIHERAVGKPDILVFKNDEAIEHVCVKNDFNLINSSYLLNKKLENKVEFTKFVDGTNIFSQPDYEIFEKLSDLDYKTLEVKFGYEFIIQFIFGHSGNTTFFIDSEAKLKELQTKYPLRKGKVSKKIEGPSYTVNACITKVGIVIGGISEQITGIPELTSSLGGTVGNDFSCRHLTEELRKEIIEKTMQFGELLQKEGHRGIFGLDFVLDLVNREIYLIEANIRQVASASYASYLQRIHQITPIMLWHVLELLDFDFSSKFISVSEEDEEWINEAMHEFIDAKDKVAANIKINQPINASQVLFRNIQDYPVQVLDQFPSGVYRIRGRMPQESSDLEENKEYAAVYKLREDGWSTLCFEERGYNVTQIKGESGFIINTVSEKTLVEPIGEIGRIQFFESAFSSKDDKYINGWLMDTIKAVYENMRVIKIQ
jgi:hypothetical protein